MSFYAVRKGRVPGIYETWGECKRQTHKYDGAEFRKFETRREAERYIGISGSPSEGACYAVKLGHVPGVYESWEECKRQTEGFENPVFRKFANRDMAEKWLAASENDLAGKSCKAYVDGSFNADTGTYGYGVILLYGRSRYEFSGKGNDPGMADMRNVAGEIEGAMRAVREALEMGFSGIRLYYDYKGVESWVTGEWQATKAGTIRYRNFMLAKKKRIGIEFEKVRAHSGVKYNEQADALAKEAAGVCP